VKLGLETIKKQTGRNKQNMMSLFTNYSAVEDVRYAKTTEK
jgi:hypothetical protein